MKRALIVLALGLAATGCRPYILSGCEAHPDLFIRNVTVTDEGGEAVFIDQDGSPDHLCAAYRTLNIDGQLANTHMAALGCRTPAPNCVVPQFTYGSTTRADYALADGSTVTIEDADEDSIERHDASGALVYRHSLILERREEPPAVSTARDGLVYVAVQDADKEVHSVDEIDLASGRVLWSTPVVDHGYIR